MTPKCDFCSEQPVVWRYHVLPLPIPMGEDWQGRTHVSNTDWAACARCKRLVDLGLREPLATRSLITHPLYGRLSERALRELHKHLTRFHDDFFRLKNGQGEPV